MAQDYTTPNPWRALAEEEEETELADVSPATAPYGGGSVDPLSKGVYLATAVSDGGGAGPLLKSSGEKFRDRRE